MSEWVYFASSAVTTAAARIAPSDALDYVLRTRGCFHRLSGFRIPEVVPRCSSRAASLDVAGLWAGLHVVGTAPSYQYPRYPDRETRESQAEPARFLSATAAGLDLSDEIDLVVFARSATDHVRADSPALLACRPVRPVEVYSPAHFHMAVAGRDYPSLAQAPIS